MTQLDRLEALAELWTTETWLHRDAEEIGRALPDLIRVARAAKTVADNGGCESYSQDEFAAWHELGAALDVLFSEVES